MTTTYRQIMKGLFQQFEIEGVTAVCIEASPGWEEDWGCPDFCRFILVEKGEATLVLDKVSQVIGPGQLLLVPAGTQQKCMASTAAGLQLFLGNLRGFVGSKQFFQTMKLPYRVRLDDSGEAVGLFHKMLAAQQSPRVPNLLRVRSALLELLACYLESPDLNMDQLGYGAEVDQLNRVMDYIDEHLDQPMHIEDLARLACLHPNYFIDFFKANVGIPPIQYVNNRRLERAKALLKNSEVPVTEIAKLVGLQNHYLSRLFKQQTGLSPSRYRKFYKQKMDE